MHVLVLGVPFLEGMAGSVRVRNLLEPLISDEKISMSNLYFSKQAGNFKSRGEAHFLEVEIFMNSISSIVNFFSNSFKFIRERKIANQTNFFYAYDTPDLKTIFLIIYAKLKGYKVIIDIVEDNSVAASYSGFLNRLRIKSGEYLVKLSPYYADLFIGISSHLVSKLKFLVNDLSKVVYIPVTVDLQKIQAVENTEGENIKILYGGSFGKKDGIEYLIGGFNRLNKSFPNVELLLTGKIDNQAYFEEILRKNGQQGENSKVKYLGFLSTSEYLEVVQKCDIFCVTRNNSQAANTGFPSKLAEFLAAGKVVVASDVGDVGKMLVDGRDLILVPPEKEEAIEEAFCRVLNNLNLRMTMGKAARKAAEENFDNRKYSSLLFERMNSLS